MILTRWVVLCFNLQFSDLHIASNNNNNVNCTSSPSFLLLISLIIPALSNSSELRSGECLFFLTIPRSSCICLFSTLFCATSFGSENRVFLSESYCLKDFLFAKNVSASLSFNKLDMCCFSCLFCFWLIDLHSDFDNFFWSLVFLDLDKASTNVIWKIFWNFGSRASKHVSAACMIAVCVGLTGFCFSNFGLFVISVRQRASSLAKGKLLLTGNLDWKKKWWTVHALQLSLVCCCFWICGNDLNFSGEKCEQYSCLCFVFHLLNMLTKSFDFLMNCDFRISKLDSNLPANNPLYFANLSSVSFSWLPLALQKLALTATRAYPHPKTPAMSRSGMGLSWPTKLGLHLIVNELRIPHSA